ncbi:MAG: (2Fe-2S)-binding protein [Chloroflexi bacterium]|nr:(2Fe-2S)-binding protein [Chloroflexota bacterium]
MVKLTIDGREFQAEEGKTILDVAQGNNIYIPTLCYHESVAPYGACRLCMVEITNKRGKKKLVTSCLYPVEEGLDVKTDTPRVVSVRRMVMEFLLARCPDSEVLRKLGDKLGVEKVRFSQEEDKNKCILCGLCARACDEVVGASAISLVNRGVDRQMATPFFDASATCIACGSCAFVCPTGAIKCEDIGDTRKLTMPNITQEFRLAKCKACGAYWAPERQVDFFVKKSGLTREEYELCPDCR